MAEWQELSDFAKGIIIGAGLWVVLLIFVAVRGIYLIFSMQDIGQNMFYIFSDSLGIFGIIVYGLFLVAVFGLIGWFFGRITGERV